MFKKILLMAAMVLPMLASAQTFKLGLADVDAILAAMPETTEANNKLQEVSTKYDEENRKLFEEMKRMYDELANLDESTPAGIRERKTRDFNEYQQKIDQFQQSATQDLQKLQNDLMQPIMQKIRTAIEAVGMEGGFSLVQTYSPQLVLYMAAPTVDITNDVKAKLGIK